VVVPQEGGQEEDAGLVAHAPLVEALQEANPWEGLCALEVGDLGWGVGVP